MGIRWQNISELMHAFSLVLSFCSFCKALEQSQLAPDKAEQALPGKETHPSVHPRVSVVVIALGSDRSSRL